MHYLCEPLEARRLCAAGDQDLSYGDNGFVRLQFGEAEYQFLPGSDPTGSATVVSMSADGESFSVRRFNAGLPDTTAGPGGAISTIPLPFDPGEHRAIPFRAWNLSGGRTVIEFITRTGQPTAESGDSWFVRLNPDRTLDTTYGTGGSILFRGRFWHMVAQQGDNLIARKDTDRDTLLRYNANGQLDTTFGSGGQDVLSDRVNALITQPDGKILVGMQSEFSVHRRNVNGGTDTTFGEGDGVTYTTGAHALYQLGLDSAGRILATGPGSMTRLMPDGQYDATFADGGVLDYDDDPALADFDGEVFLEGAGMVTFLGGRDFIKVDANGDRDTAFGRVAVDLRLAFVGRPPTHLLSEAPSAVAQPDGSVLAQLRVMDGRFIQARIAGGGSAPASVALDAGVIRLTGTDRADRIENSQSGSTVDAYVNGVGRMFLSQDASSYEIDARAGNDLVTVYSFVTPIPAVIHGGAGNDRLTGGRGDDTIFGNAGNDRIDGSRGNDRLEGNGGRDKLAGGYGDPDGPLRDFDGDDRLFGGDGGDWLNGGWDDDLLFGQLGNDYLDGGRGSDRLMGSDGNDVFVSRDDSIDDLYGGGGTDTLMAGDDDDLLTSIETT